MRRSLLLSLAISVLCVLLAAPVAADTQLPRGSTAIDAPVRNGLATDNPVTNGSVPPDPETDVLGWEDGYWHNESIDVDQSDALSAGERERLLARTMARVEYIRKLEFTSPTHIEFVSPEGVREYVDENVTQLRGGNTTWEALFIVGEDANARKVVRETVAGSVAGMAREEGVDHIVLVTPNPERPRVAEYVLAHELVHVLQYQQFNLSAPRYHRSTMDGELGKDALVEGEASLVDGHYRRRCANGEWSCTSGDVATGRGRVNPTIAALMSVPYRRGAQYVASLYEDGGWSAVTAAHRSPPVTAAVMFHPDRDAPSLPDVDYTDRSSKHWQPTGDRQRIGEAGIRTLFARQNRTRGVSLSANVTGDASPVATVANGWANDALLAYTNGSHHGYVWVTEWDSPADAREFATAYRAVLESYDPLAVGDSRYVLTAGPFADAFDVRRNGTRVTIVNGPDRASLPAIDGRLSRLAGPPTRLSPSTPSETSVTTTGGPGFGAVVAMIGILAAAGIRRRQWS